MAISFISHSDLIDQATFRGIKLIRYFDLNQVICQIITGKYFWAWVFLNTFNRKSQKRYIDFSSATVLMSLNRTTFKMGHCRSRNKKVLLVLTDPRLCWTFWIPAVCCTKGVKLCCSYLQRITDVYGLRSWRWSKRLWNSCMIHNKNSETVVLIWQQFPFVLVAFKLQVDNSQSWWT